MKTKRYLAIIIIALLALSLCLLAACNPDGNEHGEDSLIDTPSTSDSLESDEADTPSTPETPDGGDSEDSSTPETPDDGESEIPDDSDEGETEDSDIPAVAPVTLDGVAYSSVREGTAYEVKYISAEASATLVIPSSVEGLPVVGIAEDALPDKYEPTSITLPDTLEYIRANENLDNVKDIATLLDGVYYLGNEQNPYLAVICFYWMDEPWEVTVHADTQVIAEGAFGGCIATSMEVAQGNEHFKSVDGVLYDMDGTTLISYPANREETSFAIPDSVTTIGDYAFFSCSLTSIDIPDGVTEIGNGVFFGCVNLATITIGSGVSTIGVDAFTLCGVRNITVSDSNPCFKSVDNIIYSKDGTVLVRYLEHKEGASFTIPHGVTTIGASAFRGCASLKEIILPESLKVIGENAFHSCTSVQEIIIPYGVTTIGENAFQSCNALTEISIPDSVTSIDEKAFVYCPRLAKIIISNNVTTISERAFSGCTSLTSIVIPDGVTTIGERAFFGCGALTEIILPDSVTVVDYGAFCFCKNLKNVNLGDNVTTIAANAFDDCDSLETITIPISVTVLGENSLGTVSSVHYEGTTAQWEAIEKTGNPFFDDGNVRTVICLDGTLTY